MAVLKVGARLRSGVCATEVMVVAAPDRDIEILCGGAPMLGAGEEPPSGGALASNGEPTLLGKRYTNPEGDLEVLCTKGGDGSLAVDGEPLAMKEAKPLPSSD